MTETLNTLVLNRVQIENLEALGFKITNASFLICLDTMDINHNPIERIEFTDCSRKTYDLHTGDHDYQYIPTYCLQDILNLFIANNYDYQIEEDNMKLQVVVRGTFDNYSAITYTGRNLLSLLYEVLCQIIPDDENFK